MRPHFRRFTLLVAVLAVLGSVCDGSAVALRTGSARIDFDKSAWDAVASGTGLPAPVLVLDAFFGPTFTESLSYQELLRNPHVESSYTNQLYAMNGAVVTNQPQRTAQATTFSFEPGSLPNHSGVIGLAGISRFKVSSGGSLLFGDFSLQYDETRLARGGSGWYLKGNIAPAAPAFDLLQPMVLETPTTVSIAGSLGIGFEVANLLFATPKDAGRVVGHFEFTGTLQLDSKPVPLVEASRDPEGKVFIRARGGDPGSSYVLEQSVGAMDSDLRWQDWTNAVFNAEGQGTWMSVEAEASSGAVRLFRVRSP